MNILVLGDIVGKPGRRAVKDLLPSIKEKYNIDFTIANGENIAGGSGVTEKTLNEVYDSGVEVITTGDHIWKKKETQGFIDNYINLVRPLNYPQGVPGRGSVVVDKIGVISLLGRIYMNPIECPFLAVEKELKELKTKTNIIIVDFHAEATSEKIAMGWFLNGEVSAVFGTHTHVATADERVLDRGTAYITDIGMTGAMDSVIGRQKAPVIKKFLTQMPGKFDLATEDVRINGAVIEIDDITGKAGDIVRIQEKL